MIHLPRAATRWARWIAAGAGSLLAPACTVHFDTSGLAGAPAEEAGSSELLADGPFADAGRALLFAEDWESTPSRWTPAPALVGEPCSTTFQRETILALGGRVRLATPISVRSGERHCLVAWVRGS